MNIRSTTVGPERRDRGASLVEYAFLVALIAAICVGAVGVLGGGTSDSLSDPELSVLGS